MFQVNRRCLIEVAQIQAHDFHLVALGAIMPTLPWCLTALMTIDNGQLHECSNFPKLARNPAGL